MYAHTIENPKTLATFGTDAEALLAGYWNEALARKGARDDEAKRARENASDARTAPAARYSFD